MREGRGGGGEWRNGGCQRGTIGHQLSMRGGGGGGGVSIHLSHGPMGIRLILIFYYFNVILLKSSGSPRPPSPPLISNKALNNERSFIL